MTRSPSFTPQKTKTWPLLLRKNLPQSEFITLKTELLFYGKKPASNSVSPTSIIITSGGGWGGVGGEEQLPSTPLILQPNPKENLNPSKKLSLTK